MFISLKKRERGEDLKPFSKGEKKNYFTNKRNKLKRKKESRELLIVMMISYITVLRVFPVGETLY